MKRILVTMALLSSTVVTLQAGKLDLNGLKVGVGSTYNHVDGSERIKGVEDLGGVNLYVEDSITDKLSVRFGLSNIFDLKRIKETRDTKLSRSCDIVPVVCPTTTPETSVTPQETVTQEQVKESSVATLSSDYDETDAVSVYVDLVYDIYTPKLFNNGLDIYVLGGVGYSFTSDLYENDMSLEAGFGIEHMYNDSIGVNLETKFVTDLYDVQDFQNLINLNLVLKF